MNQRLARMDVLPPEPQPRPRKRIKRQSRVSALMASAMFWLGMSGGIGAIVIICGVYLLAGAGWALIAIGMFLFAVAWLLHLGIAHG